MNARLLVLGLALAACAVPAHAQQQKMPIPVEDDTNAPPEMRGQKVEQPPPSVSPEAEALALPPSSPYSEAMVRYKAGDYQQALAAIKDLDPAKQDDNFVILEANILTELKRYDDGEKLLRQRIAAVSPDPAHPNLSAPHSLNLVIALGDLLLHKRSYERAAKYYTAALQARPNDPDLTLKLIYARIGSGDLRAADQLATQLSPFDPKNPYDDHASYYFARAALAQATGKSSEADDDIQNARTSYGIMVTNRYLKTYLQFVAPPDTNAPSDIVPSSPAK